MKEGWEKKAVGEIAAHSLGKMLDKAKNKGEPKPYLRNLNVRWFDFDLSDVLEMRFLPEEATKYTAIKGDVLICEGGYPGRAAIWQRDEPIYFQKALHRVRFNEPERNKWFLYYLLSKDLDGTLRNHFNGAGIQHFTGEALAQFEVPLPLLPEQHRIVGILDEAFEGIATAKANAEKNLENARAVFESEMNAFFAKKGNGWKETHIGEQLTLQRGFDITKSEQVDGVVPVVSSGGIKSYHSNAIVSAPGVVIGRKGTLGKVFYLEKDFWPHDTTLWVKDFKGNNPKLIYYFFLGLDVKKFDSGAANPALNRNNIHPLLVNWPPISQQASIVSTLDSLSAETERLESIYKRKLSALDALKKSLLHDAFTGKL
ncbi:restriction endonuclease subunit S [Thiocapsa roseopersicina]|uniref:Restriction endonuclease S subunit n=1 Tax=Thiocapsa roseopersicina TaxID=1058 RepID=A0A1H2T5Y5_THIRO|nr:restriction endonuclease subunit S [Thiocapsa roseopersicina]SDW39230.1 Restriction endonuclease S subunit [Thiocapsa roseopersicina]